MISLRLYGPFSIRDAEGRDLTPRGAKTQAMVAMLATAAEMVRSRTWLQANLWGDRGAGQAAGSLRQALYELRRALGPAAGVLSTDRLTVSLNPERVRVLPRPTDVDAPFLEGIDLNEPGFEDWLRLHRADDARPASPSFRIEPAERPLSVLMVIEPVDGEHDRLFVQMVADAFANELSERALADVHVAERPDRDTDATLNLQFHQEPRILRAQMTAHPSRRHIWAQTLHSTGPDRGLLHQADVARFINGGIEAIVTASLRSGDTADRQGGEVRRAMRLIFGFRPEDLRAADTLLQRAAIDDPAALGWRVFLRMVERVETAGAAGPDFARDVENLMHDALARAPQNAMVLSAAAHACIKVLDRPDDAIALARRAMSVSWSNPFALDVLSDALLMQGAAEEAYAMARRAQAVGQGTPMSHFFDMGLCLACVATDRHEEALTLARQAAALSPGFRPPLRYLVVLNAALGRNADAERALTRLRVQEPGLDPRRLIKDRDYPVATFRNSPFAARPETKGFF